MVYVELGVEFVVDLDGGFICVFVGIFIECVLVFYFENNNIDVEVVVFEKGDEVKIVYFNQCCDGLILFVLLLVVICVIFDNLEVYDIFFDVLGLELEVIIVFENDLKWFDV